MNQFAEKYKSLNNADLLKIIANPRDYQSLAVETAEVELANRQLSAEELESAKAEIDLELQEKAIKKEKRQAVENKINEMGASVMDAIDPIRRSTPSTIRVINFISAALGVMFLMTLFKEFGLITFMLFDKESRWDLTMLSYFVQLVFVPTLTLFFWRRKRAGWILLWIYCNYSVINGAALLIIMMKNTYLFSTAGGFFPAISQVSFLWDLFFFGGCFWFIGKKSIRDVYQVSQRSMAIIAGVTGAIAIGLIWISLAAH